jgi:hypothetical protein
VCDRLSFVAALKVMSIWGAEALPMSGLLWATFVMIVKPATLRAPLLI